MSSNTILAIGEPLIEMIRQPGLLKGRAHYCAGLGGDVLNAMVSAARQGAQAGLVTAVGGDPFGEEVIAFCQAEGIDRQFIARRAQDPTGVVFIDPDPSNRRFSYARRGSAASHYSVADLPEAAIAAAQVLHVSSIGQAISTSMRNAITRAARIARQHGTLVSYDLNLRLSLWSLDEAREVIDAFLPLADVVLPSDDEAQLLLGDSDPEAVLTAFARHGARWVVLKQGAAGVILQNEGNQHRIPAPNVDAVDSTGAGDSFAGAFLAYLLETGDAVEAATRAVRVAAATVSGYGATEPIPRRADVLKQR